MRRAARHVNTIALLLLGSIAAGCGDDTRPADTTPGAGTATTTTAVEEPDRDATPAEEDDDAPPTPAQLAAGRGLDRLAAAYAPVSARINFLVTAETLRADAVDSDAGDVIVQERAGVARIEAERMADVLGAARAKVAGVSVRSTAQQQVQQLLLEAIDARSRAMVELIAAIDAQSLGLGDSVIEERTATWRESWDASVRATREATTITQDARAVLGLEPAREEALR